MSISNNPLPNMPRNIDNTNLQGAFFAVGRDRSIILKDSLLGKIDSIKDKNRELKALRSYMDSARTSKLKSNMVDSPTFKVETQGDSKVIKLDNGYSVEIKSNEWFIKDTAGGVTRIWGDPHVDLNNDGKTDWDFKAQSTFLLNDGTKITVSTKPMHSGTVTDSLHITRGNQRISATGFFTESGVKVGSPQLDGLSFDSATNDGYIFYESKNGVKSWDNKAGKAINSDQAPDTNHKNELVGEPEPKVDQVVLDYLNANGYKVELGMANTPTKGEWDTIVNYLSSRGHVISSYSQMDMVSLQKAMHDFDLNGNNTSNVEASFNRSKDGIARNF